MSKDLLPGQLQGRATFNNMKKYLLLFGGLFALLLALVALSFFLQGGQPGRTSQAPMPTSFPLDYPVPSGISAGRSGKIIIKGVEVNNFFTSAKKINNSGDIELSKNSDYSIQYYPVLNSFLITIVGVPFEETKTEAEEDFLKILGVKPQIACQLTINISASPTIYPELTGDYFKPYFCKTD